MLQQNFTAMVQGILLLLSPFLIRLELIPIDPRYGAILLHVISLRTHRSAISFIIVSITLFSIQSIRLIHKIPFQVEPKTCLNKFTLFISSLCLHSRFQFELQVEVVHLPTYLHTLHYVWELFFSISNPQILN